MDSICGFFTWGFIFMWEEGLVHQVPRIISLPIGFPHWDHPYMRGFPHWSVENLNLMTMKYNIFWMIIMCCAVSYLYIELLTQLWYLINVGFLNIPPQTQYVIFYETFEFGNKRIVQISWLNSTWLVSQLDGSDLGSEA